MKILNKEFAEKKLLEHFLPREVHSLKVLRHENILEFYEVYDLKQRIIFVMELAENGDLMDYLQYRKMKISEPEARYFFRQIVSAVHYCHSKRFAHRDIKIENFLVTKDMTVKLGGMCVHVLCRSRGGGGGARGKFQGGGPETSL